MVTGSSIHHFELPACPPTARGASCTNTILAALQDTQIRPEILHIVGASEAEFSINWALLAKGLPSGARIVLIGPHIIVKDGASREDLLGPAERFGLQISVFPQTYQRYMVVCHQAEAPQFVVLFHPGLDIHYFTWYPCLKFWVDSRIPVLITAYKRPQAMGETPALVKTFLETLVGAGGGAGMWVIEEENPHSADEGAFNAGYFVILGSEGTLPLRPEEMYFSLFQALHKEGYPFAPRVGYLDTEDDGQLLDVRNPRVMAAIAEGAIRGASVGVDACDDATAKTFAKTVLDSVLGYGSGETWQKLAFERAVCENCGEGYDDAEWHRSLCPAMSVLELKPGDHIRLANLHKEAYNGREGVLVHFNRQKHRWVVSMDGKEALFKAANIHKLQV